MSAPLAIPSKRLLRRRTRRPKAQTIPMLIRRDAELAKATALDPGHNPSIVLSRGMRLVRMEKQEKPGGKPQLTALYQDTRLCPVLPPGQQIFHIERNCTHVATATSTSTPVPALNLKNAMRKYYKMRINALQNRIDSL